MSADPEGRQLRPQPDHPLTSGYRTPCSASVSPPGPSAVTRETMSSTANRQRRYGSVRDACPADLKFCSHPPR